MATGASNADLAVLLVDARRGILTQTRRHAFIASLLGIRHVVLAVNKIDLMDYDEAVFRRIVADFEAFAADLGFATRVAVPLSARFGVNVLDRGDAMPWYDGPTLVEHLETVEVDRDRTAAPFRMPVQWVNRPDLDFRGFSGTVTSGTIRPGDAIVVANHLIWMSDEPAMPGRSYFLKIGTKLVSAQITEIKHKIDVDSFGRLAAKQLALNEVAVVNVALSEAIAFDPYAVDHDTGAFIVIDRLTNLTVGAGMIDFALRRAANIHWQALDVTKQARAEAKGQRPVVLWFTGLSGAGKSTIANLVEKKLHHAGRHTYVLDGDNVRHGLAKDLGFTAADRVENIRRVAETAKLFVDAGLIVLTAFISPFRSERRLARDILEPGEFVEIHVATPLEVAEARDPKGLYAKARAGKLENFTGIDSPYEAPEAAELVLDTTAADAEALADRVIAHLRANGYV